MWFKVDDHLPTHRKVLAVKRGTRRLAAVGGWTLMGAWISGNGTDGLIPEDVAVDDLGITKAVIADLLDTGRITVEGKHYRMHDFLDYNPTAEKVAAERHAAAERQRISRENRAKEKAAEKARGKESRRTSRVTEPVTNGEVTAPVTPTPTRPDPTRPEKYLGSVERTPEVEVARSPLRVVPYGPEDLATWDQASSS